MSKPLVALRNKISRQAYQVPADEADQILAHPVWGKVNEVVRTAKPEVLHKAKDEGDIEDTQPMSQVVPARKTDNKKDNA